MYVWSACISSSTAPQIRNVTNARRHVLPFRWWRGLFRILPCGWCCSMNLIRLLWMEVMTTGSRTWTQRGIFLVYLAWCSGNKIDWLGWYNIGDITYQWGYKLRSICLQHNSEEFAIALLDFYRTNNDSPLSLTFH